MERYRDLHKCYAVNKKNLASRSPRPKIMQHISIITHRKYHNETIYQYCAGTAEISCFIHVPGHVTFPPGSNIDDFSSSVSIA